MLIFGLLITLAVLLVTVSGCSNLIVSSGASSDSSTIIAYNADSGTLYGSLYHYPAADHEPGDMKNIFDWDSGEYLGQIPEVPHTYNVVGNINEFGLLIGETTFGGLSSLQHQSNARIDYGSLIWTTLQRAKTAREAILTIDSLMTAYGYASEGESFSIADNNEAWVMEIIGKGDYEKGAVWVARKVPDGYISGHANQARITTFPLHDENDTLYAKDVISFAKKIGVYPADGKDEDFSFSDVYDPVTFSGARFCEARVWSMFSSVMGSEWQAQYLNYAQGQDLANRMPLFVKPANKLSVAEVMQIMRSHYENTELDMTGTEFSDVGASFSATPVRTHPLSWTSSAQSKSGVVSQYFNERPIATQQTGWNFVAQSRRWLKPELSGLLWFGVDDSSTTVHFPIYGSATRIPLAFAGAGAQDGQTPPMMVFDMQRAHHVFNLVANWAYSRWDLMYPELLQTILARESMYFTAIAKVDEEASQIYEQGSREKAIEVATQFSNDIGNQLVSDWANYFGQLFVKYRDGYVFTSNDKSHNCGCTVSNGPYSQEWYDRIVQDTGDHYKVPELSYQSQLLNKPEHKPIHKLELLKRK